MSDDFGLARLFVAQTLVCGFARQTQAEACATHL